MGDFNAIPDEKTVSWMTQDAGFKSSYREFHGEEPQKTYNTGLISPYMDTDPPCTVDYIFYRNGQSGEQVVPRVRLTMARVMGEKHEIGDDTLYGSDHYPLIADFEFTLHHRTNPHHIE